MLPSMFSLSQRCQTGRRQCVMISATMRLVKRSNRGGTPAVTIDAALGGGMSEGGEAGVFQHGCMDNEKLRRMRLRASVPWLLQNNISGEHVNQRACEDPPHPVSLLVALGSISRTRVIHPAMPKSVANRWCRSKRDQLVLVFFQNCCDGKKAIYWISRYSRVSHQSTHKEPLSASSMRCFLSCCLPRSTEAVDLPSRKIIDSPYF
jgi:hypothetical protein